MTTQVEGAKATENKISLLGDTAKVVTSRLGQQATFVDQFDEGEASVLLEGVLPFLKSVKNVK